MDPVEFIISQWIVISVGFISLIPTIVLFRQYQKTSVLDFLLFSGVFFSVTIAVFSLTLAAITNIIFFFQLHYLTLAFTSLFFFLHGSRILWTRTPSVIWYIGIIWFAIIVFLIFFWEIMPQEESAFVLLMEMPAVPSNYHPQGAGIKTSGGIVLYSTSHRILSVLYSIYAVGILGYAYITIDPSYPTKKILRSKQMWLITWNMVLIYYIFQIPWIYKFIGFTSITTIVLLILIAETICACIAIFIPESMLMSHTQLLRAQQLYKKVQQLKSTKEIAQFGMGSLVEYLRSIPRKVLQEIEVSK